MILLKSVRNIWKWLWASFMVASKLLCLATSLRTAPSIWCTSPYLGVCLSSWDLFLKKPSTMRKYSSVAPRVEKYFGRANTTKELMHSSPTFWKVTSAKEFNCDKRGMFWYILYLFLFAALYSTRYYRLTEYFLQVWVPFISVLRSRASMYKVASFVIKVSTCFCLFLKLCALCRDTTLRAWRWFRYQVFIVCNCLNCNYHCDYHII